MDFKLNNESIKNTAGTIVKKLKSYAWIAAFVFISMYLFSSWSAGKAQERWVRAETENRQVFAQMEKDISELTESNAARENTIDLLKSSKAILESKNRFLKKEQAKLSAESIEESVGAIDLTLGETAAGTALRLQVEPLSITATENGLLFNEESATKNLQSIIIGNSAVLQLSLSQKRISNFEEQVAGDLRIMEEQKFIIINKNEELSIERNKFDRKVAELELKVRAERAKSRKKQLTAGVIGVVVGLAVSRF